MTGPRCCGCLQAADDHADTPDGRMCLTCFAEARERLKDDAIAAACVWSDAVEQGFASDVRPDVARAAFERARRALARFRGTA